MTPFPDPGIAAGLGRLTVARVDGASAAVLAGAGNPLKLFVSQPRGPAVWAFATTFGGGLLAGDRITLDVTVDPGASLFLGTQASTKIYRSDDGRESTQTTRARIADGGLLVWLPDPVTPFAGSRLRQALSVTLGAGAGLVALDAVTAGRVARDEHWAATAIRSRIALDDDRGAPLLRDAMELIGNDLPRRLSGVGCLATLVIAGAPVAELASRILADVSAAGAGTWPGGILAAASPLTRGTGTILRLAAPEWPTAEAWLRTRFGSLAGHLGGEPWLRRP